MGGLTVTSHADEMTPWAVVIPGGTYTGDEEHAPQPWLPRLPNCWRLVRPGLLVYTGATVVDCGGLQARGMKILTGVHGKSSADKVTV